MISGNAIEGVHTPFFFLLTEYTMAATIAPSIFATGPTDTVATVDVYVSTNIEVKNKIADNTSAAKVVVNESLDKILDISKTLKPGKLSKLGIKGVKAQLASIEAITKGDAKDRLEGLLGRGVVNDLATTTVTGLLAGLGVRDTNGKLSKSLLGLAGGVKPIDALIDGNPKLKILSGAYETLHAAKDLRNSKDIVGTLNKILGNSELASVLDLESKFVVMQTLLDKAVHLGVPELYDKIFAHFHKPDERRSFSNAAIDSAIRSPNIDVLNLILDSIGSAALLSKFPTAISIILRNYKYPKGLKSATAGEAVKLVALLARIDPYWLQYLRNGVWISNLEPLSYASVESMALLRFIPDVRTEWLIAKSYPSSTILGVYRRAYPRAGI
jgi:hypothetical protein